MADILTHFDGVDLDAMLGKKAPRSSRWPAVSKKTGGPIGNRPENIQLALDALGVKLYRDLFLQRDFVQFGNAPAEMLDDQALRNLYWRVQKVKIDGMSLTPPRAAFDDYTAWRASQSTRHVIRDYLAGLRWDGKPRLDTWLIDYVGAPDTPYTRAVGRKLLIAAVRRVRQPGCKFDFVLILEGPQGLGKSSVIRALAGEWFSDGVKVGADAKETIEQTAGVWFAELAELAGLRRKEVEEVKSFASRQVDEARLAYGRTTERVPRQFVCVATINPDVTGEYLLDATGNRRFWPVRVTRCDVEGIKRDRDQIFAEAALAEATGEIVYLTDETEKAALAEQGARLVGDPWEDIISNLVQGREGKIATETLWTALKLDGGRQNPLLAARLAEVMTKLGFTKHRLRQRTDAFSSKGTLKPCWSNTTDEEYAPWLS